MLRKAIPRFEMDDFGSVGVLGAIGGLLALLVVATVVENAEAGQRRRALDEVGTAAAAKSAQQSARMSNIMVDGNAVQAIYGGLEVALKSIETHVTCASNIATAICRSCSCPGCCGCCAACIPAEILDFAEKFTTKVVDAVEPVIHQIKEAISEVEALLDTKMPSIIQDIGIDTIKEALGEAAGWIYNPQAMARQYAEEVLGQMMNGLDVELPEFPEELRAAFKDGVDAARDAQALYGRLINMKLSDIPGALDVVQDTTEYLGKAGEWLGLGDVGFLEGIGGIAGQIGGAIGQVMDAVQGVLGVVQDLIGQFDKLLAWIGTFWNFNPEKLLCFITAAIAGSISEALIWPIKMFCKLGGGDISSALADAASGCFAGSNDMVPCSEGMGTDGGSCDEGSKDLAHVSFIREEPWLSDFPFRRVAHLVSGAFKDSDSLEYQWFHERMLTSSARVGATGCDDKFEHKEKGLNTCWEWRSAMAWDFAQSGAGQ